MRQLNGVYTQALNHRHGHFGHLFQGRYKSVLVEKDAYLLEVARYIVLNPVRVGMVGYPGCGQTKVKNKNLNPSTASMG